MAKPAQHSSANEHAGNEIRPKPFPSHLLARGAKVGIFVALLTLATCWCLSLFKIHDNVSTQAILPDFYELPEDSVDAVFIGPSFFQEVINPTLMFQETGVATYNLSFGGLPFIDTKNLIAEAERVQDPDVYFVNVQHAGRDVGSKAVVRRPLDTMARTKNWWDMASYLENILGRFYPGAKDTMLDYLLPITTYHNRWKDLTYDDFAGDNTAFMGYALPSVDNVIAVPQDRSEFDEQLTATPRPLNEAQRTILDDLLEYCDGLGKRVVFVTSPVINGKDWYSSCNWVRQYVEERGYEFWDLGEQVDAIGLDFENDYKNAGHTNDTGSAKVSRYVARELSGRFGLADHRDDQRYRAWDERYAAYRRRAAELSLAASKDLTSYLRAVGELNEQPYRIFIAGAVPEGIELPSEISSQLAALGLKNAHELVTDSGISMAFVIDSGDVLLESLDSRVQYHQTIDGQEVLMSCQGVEGSSRVNLKLGTRTVSTNEPGLCIAIENVERGQLLDSAVFSLPLGQRV